MYNIQQSQISDQTPTIDVGSLQVRHGHLELFFSELLTRLQDLTLGAADQAARGIPCRCPKCKIELNVAKNFDACFIEQLGLGLMSHLRSLRFDIDDIRIDIDDVLQLVRGGGLQSLTIIVSTSSALHQLERIVPLVKAPELTVKVLCVVNKRPSPRLLFNTFDLKMCWIM